MAEFKTRVTILEGVGAEPRCGVISVAYRNTWSNGTKGSYCPVEPTAANEAETAY
jgi:hypothetical protein